jgi:hypothetical protein
MFALDSDLSDLHLVGPNLQLDKVGHNGISTRDRSVPRVLFVPNILVAGRCRMQPEECEWVIVDGADDLQIAALGPPPSQQSERLDVDAFAVGANLDVLLWHHDIVAVDLLDNANLHLERGRNNRARDLRIGAQPPHRVANELG